MIELQQRAIDSAKGVWHAALQDPSAVAWELGLTTIELAAQFKGRKQFKGLGEDGIGGELYKAAPAEFASAMRGLFWKSVFTLSEPLLWRGAFCQELFKGKGDPAATKSYRDINLEDDPAKVLHSAYRGAVRARYYGAARHTQCGGIDGRGVDTAAMLGRAVQEWAAVTETSA
eukprot:2580372-Lingulodinium_polyedra.AAC.1